MRFTERYTQLQWPPKEGKMPSNKYKKCARSM